jgi:hypothetical protein
MLQETVVDGNGDQVREVFGNDYHVIHRAAGASVGRAFWKATSTASYGAA